MTDSLSTDPDFDDLSDSERQ